MSRDFWFGMFAIPAAALAVAIIGLSIAGFIYLSAKVSLWEYKVWPKESKAPEVLAAVVANAKSRRYFWIPGWHVVVCRTTLWHVKAKEDLRAHQRVQVAVRNAITAEDWND